MTMIKRVCEIAIQSINVLLDLKNLEEEDRESLVSAIQLLDKIGRS
jgi:hypothetical protein